MKATFRQRWFIVTVAAVLAVVGVVGVIVHHDIVAKPKPTVGLPVSPQLDTGGLASATLLAHARDVTYHATYTSTADPKVSGGTIAMEIWNTKGKSRVDTSLTTPTKEVQLTASILQGNKVVTCQQPPKGQWSCQSAPSRGAGDPAGLIASVESQLQDRPVAETSGKVGGREAHCFHVGPTAGAEAIDVCVDERGVLLKLSSSDATIEIAKLDTVTPGSAFDPPANVKS